MTYIKDNETANRFKVGDWTITKRKVECGVWCFEKGTKVKVIGKGQYGYDLEDEHGNTILDTGYDSIE